MSEDENNLGLLRLQNETSLYGSPPKRTSLRLTPPITNFSSLQK
jgi:hypothetical protein